MKHNRKEEWLDMISLYKVLNTYTKPSGTYKAVELRGLSTDTKPTEIRNNKIDNGSEFIEIDTGKLFLYDLDNEEWKEI